MEEADAAVAAVATTAEKVEVAVGAVADADGAADEMTDDGVAAADGAAVVGAADAAVAAGGGAVGELEADDRLDRNH